VLLGLAQAAAVGATLGLVYWLTLRLLAPQAFGARNRSEFTRR
jgi:hypothetical protein